MQQSSSGPAGFESEFEPVIVTIESITTAVIGGTVAQDDLPAFFDSSFRTLAPAIAAQGVQITGPAFGLFRGMPSEPVDIEVGFPTDHPVDPSGDVAPGSLPAGRVARMVHAGGFDKLADSWARLFAWVGDQGHTPATIQWEVYLTEPSPDMNPDDLRVELNLPVEG
ncbi:GyrI-like domain-containing protein [Streptomonospora wellingtoniae]|uniref:GyrI-like domain-containing protein n=1 Tax=Streptomonospora wellingtoniae TaxID=3075544 RepID=A0ABU2KN65_9ACTN|nr:GyrI-like domain-containing protein [Streptomonospora sp. DSM 45055]MDT0300710.1 GyrI-like domain-containing protein [Streptomonospora sp. DSM 45055]